MFEFGSGVERVHDSDSPIVAGALEQALGAVPLRRSLTLWAEHCSECAMPSCYSSCAFYTPRQDYKCRRFSGGVSILPPSPFTAAPMRLRFGKWARLLGYGPRPLIETSRAVRKGARALWAAEIATAIPSVQGLVAPVMRRVYQNAQEHESWGKEVRAEGLYLVVEVENPGSVPVSLSLSCRVLSNEPDEPRAVPFEAILQFPPGYAVRAVPVSSFVSSQDVGRQFAMELSPSDHEAHPELTFGFLDIAQLDGPPRSEVLVPSRSRGTPTISGKPKIKCVVWDLDNTLWEGVLVEDDIRGVRLRAEAVDVIRELDRRGILQSVASKNDPELALEALEHFGLNEYFLAPQISWEPKSQAITAIAESLNIGRDTFVFVDDQEFERAEVSSRHPEVAVIDTLSPEILASDPRFDVEITEEAANRRRLYQAEAKRSAARPADSGDYEEFLRSCSMRVEISELAETHVTRAHELAQRTNQLNIWSSRYTMDQIRGFLPGGSSHDAYTIRAEDRFGSYGLIGLCVFDPSEGLVCDLMFSCRIQGKLVGESFLAWLADRHGNAADSPLRARYKPTPRNGPVRALLVAGGFEKVDERDEGEIWAQIGPFRRLEEIGQIVRVETTGAPDAIGSDR